jgi:cell division protein ZapA|tara:strand:+ start:543 stop:989 length:447 start_codon:yes stop_codon:yes gene_type:complete
MANVNIKFNGKDYLLSCDNGQEEHLTELAEYLDKRFKELKSELGSIGESKLLLISSIKVVDEYYEIKKSISKKKEEFNILSDKFKELKSLVVEYKKNKDNEISKLSSDLNGFKEMVDQNKVEYESMLDRATQSIEEFIEKSSQDKPLQ